MKSPVRILWIEAGVIGGLAASIVYPLLLFAPLPLAATAVLAAMLGPAIGLGSLGLRELLRLESPSVAATIGAIGNLIAGALFTSMALVQLAVRQGSVRAVSRDVVGVWLGLDVAWDVYIGLGTLAFAVAMIRHPRFGRSFAISGFVAGAAVLITNLVTFPVPPAEAGWLDVGPLVGLWYLAATVQAWRSLGWARRKLETSAGVR